MAKSKKELNKDLMFSKIMPALNSNPFCADASADQTGEKADFLPTSTDGETDCSQAVAAQSDMEASPRTLFALRDKIFARSSDFVESETTATINVMENLVLKHVDSVIQKFNVCGCDRCRCDICAYALNILPPHYAVVEPSRIQRVEAEIPQRIVLNALVRAALRIRSNPHH